MAAFLYIAGSLLVFLGVLFNLFFAVVGVVILALGYLCGQSKRRTDAAVAMAAAEPDEPGELPEGFVKLPPGFGPSGERLR